MILELVVAVESTLLATSAILLRAYARANDGIQAQATERVREERERAERRIDESADACQELLRQAAERETALIDRIATEPELHLQRAEAKLPALQDRVSISDWDDKTWDELHQPVEDEVS